MSYASTFDSRIAWSRVSKPFYQSRIIPAEYLWQLSILSSNCYHVSLVSPWFPQKRNYFALIFFRCPLTCLRAPRYVCWYLCTLRSVSSISSTWAWVNSKLDLRFRQSLIRLLVVVLTKSIYAVRNVFIDDSCCLSPFFTSVRPRANVESKSTKIGSTKCRLNSSVVAPSNLGRPLFTSCSSWNTGISTCPRAIRDLAKTPRRRRRQRHNTKGLMSKDNRSARAFYILVYFLWSSAKQQFEMTKFEVLWRTWSHGSEFFIFFLNLKGTPTNLVPG